MNQTQGSRSIHTRTWVFNSLKIFYNNDKNIMASKKSQKYFKSAKRLFC